MVACFKNNNNKYIYLLTITGNLLALTGDTTLTWSSPVLPKLYSNDTNINPLGKPITNNEESWIGSLQYIGAMTGSFGFSFLADKIGRKPTLLILALPHIISYVTFAFAESIELIYFGRFLGGISLSSVYVILPMYISEIAEDSNRGMLLVSYSTFASFGDLLPYILGPYMSLLYFNLILSVFPLIFLIAFCYLAIESPYYYLKTNQTDKAINSLKQIRNSEREIEEEIEKIKSEIYESKLISNIKETLLKKSTVKGFLIGVTLSSLQQLSGIGAVLAYTQIIFETAGSDLPAEISSIIVGLVLFLGSFVGPLLVDRKGRKFLLICSSIGMIISETILGIYFYYPQNSFRWLPIVCLVVFTITFNIGFGPLPFTLTSEVLPINVKFFLATIVGFSGWLSSFVVTKFFNDLNGSLGESGTFWLFSGVCALALVFVVVYVPETKGKSFKEIQAILAK